MVSMVSPHPTLQHHPTMQRTTVQSCATPTAKLIRKAKKRLSPQSLAAKRV